MLHPNLLRESVTYSKYAIRTLATLMSIVILAVGVEWMSHMGITTTSTLF
jgi:hypothetical protein